MFDPRNNALNAWRLALATSVIVWHSWPLTGRTITYKPLEQLIEQVGVDGFFAISGFLITASWLRNPRLRDFAIARGLRIFPGLWVCLAIIAFAFAPLSVVIQHGSVSNLMSSYKPVEYFLNNGLLNVYYAGVDGTPRGVPWPGVWNGSIWTLVFEIICYIAVAVLGVSGLLNKRWTPFLQMARGRERDYRPSDSVVMSGAQWSNMPCPVEVFSLSDEGGPSSGLDLMGGV